MDNIIPETRENPFISWDIQTEHTYNTHKIRDFDKATIALNISFSRRIPPVEQVNFVKKVESAISKVIDDGIEC